ncbi:hypothetical protein ACJX0J_029258, partial [Zea mays]
LVWPSGDNVCHFIAHNLSCYLLIYAMCQYSFPGLKTAVFLNHLLTFFLPVQLHIDQTPDSLEVLHDWKKKGDGIHGS